MVAREKLRKLALVCCLLIEVRPFFNPTCMSCRVLGCYLEWSCSVTDPWPPVPGMWETLFSSPVCLLRFKDDLSFRPWAPLTSGRLAPFCCGARLYFGMNLVLFYHCFMFLQEMLVVIKTSGRSFPSWCSPKRILLTLLLCRWIC